MSITSSKYWTILSTRNPSTEGTWQEVVSMDYLDNISNGTASNETSPTNCSPYESPAYAKVALASAISASASLLASVFVIFIIVFYKKYNFISQRLILYLAISSMLSSISSMVHRVNYNNEMSTFYTNFCIFAGFFEQTTSWMVLNAITVLTTYLFVLVSFQKDIKKLEVLFILLIFLFPIVISLIPFIESSYGESGAWCWIRSEDRTTCEEHPLGRILIFIMWFAPVHILLLAMVVMYIVILTCIRPNQWKYKPWGKKITEDTRKENRKQAIRLVAYPSIYLFLSCFPLMNRIQNGVERGEPSLAFWYMSAVMFPLAGGLIGLAYALDPETRKRLSCAHCREALKQWRKDECKEYPVTEDLEESLPTKHPTAMDPPYTS